MLDMVDLALLAVIALICFATFFQLWERYRERKTRVPDYVTDDCRTCGKRINVGDGYRKQGRMYCSTPCIPWIRR